jgi:hypothetical protein
MLTRITLTLLLILMLAVAILLFPDAAMLPMIGTAAAVLLFAPIWFVGNQAARQSFQGAQNPARLDREAKQLIDVIMNSSNAVGFHEIGGKTQDTIVANMRDLKAGKIKNAHRAVKSLGAVPVSKFNATRNPARLSATLAKYYLLADDKTDDGERLRMRINNFIAGISDASL